MEQTYYTVFNKEMTYFFRKILLKFYTQNDKIN